MEHQEVVMKGGRESIRRAGNEVLRPLNPWTPKVHEFLRYLEAKGFHKAPRVIRIDNQTEVLSWVEGTSSNYPLTGEFASLEALQSAARLLREYHDVAKEYVTNASPDGWMLPAASPAEVMCHATLRLTMLFSMVLKPQA